MYNGWTNYETWLCNLWLDQYFQSYFENENLEEIETGDLADRIGELIEELKPETENASFFSDLMNATISRINYYELAKNLQED